MNTRAEIALENFSKSYQEFLDECDKLEESGRWNTDELGPAAVYFESDVFGAILQVMSVVGVSERTEAEVLNALFGTQYTPRELSDMYQSAKPTLQAYLNEDSDDALTLLQKIDPNMAESYRNLILEACRIVSLSDGVAEKSERMLIASLREALT